jgi:hypothetical protein
MSPEEVEERLLMEEGIEDGPIWATGEEEIRPPAKPLAVVDQNPPYPHEYGRFLSIGLPAAGSAGRPHDVPTSTFSCDIAYSLSPAASRALWLPKRFTGLSFLLPNVVDYAQSILKGDTS